ncbi:hypothetical protein ATP06_0216300 [Amycolatopsis regifaucium]|uniref:Uncharacterized protein n=1 Tax=Amycolatopsis regifaucium TaxID=546365 RepID=A0ABX3DU11_9PSEU|nr:hypothetical protein ATP06_0216300 [Amycolatopsis regifaucium]
MGRSCEGELGPSLRRAVVPAHLMGRVAATSRMPAMCAAPFGAFLVGWLATTCQQPNGPGQTRQVA